MDICIFLDTRRKKFFRVCKILRSGNRYFYNFCNAKSVFQGYGKSFLLALLVDFFHRNYVVIKIYNLIVLTQWNKNNDQKREQDDTIHDADEPS